MNVDEEFEFDDDDDDDDDNYLCTVDFFGGSASLGRVSLVRVSLDTHDAHNSAPQCQPRGPSTIDCPPRVPNLYAQPRKFSSDHNYLSLGHCSTSSPSSDNQHHLSNPL